MDSQVIYCVLHVGEGEQYYIYLTWYIRLQLRRKASIMSTCTNTRNAAGVSPIYNFSYVPVRLFPGHRLLDTALAFRRHMATRLLRLPPLTLKHLLMVRNGSKGKTTAPPPAHQRFTYGHTFKEIPANKSAHA